MIKKYGKSERNWIAIGEFRWESSHGVYDRKNSDIAGMIYRRIEYLGNFLAIHNDTSDYNHFHIKFIDIDIGRCLNSEYDYTIIYFHKLLLLYMTVKLYR